MVDRDLSLWRSWRDRSDGDAFGALVGPHVDFASRLARRSGLAPADADDVVQLSLIRLAAEPSDRPARVGLRAWLGRSVVNETRMLFRARRRRAEHEANPPLRADAASDPVEVRDEVERALSELDESSRRIVELRYFHDLEYREIAFIEGGTPLGARLRVHRALSRLRGRLGRGAALSIATWAVVRADTASADVVVGRCIEAIRAGRVAVSVPVAASVVAGGVLVGTIAKVGFALLAIALVWSGAVLLRRDDADAPTVQATRVAARTTRLGPDPAAPALAASGVVRSDRSSTSTAASTSATAVGPAAAPLDAPIPSGKGSVAGVVRFEDGTPFAGARIGLLASRESTTETDADGRFHIHGTPVGDRVLTLVGTDGSVLGLASVTLRADSLVTADVTMERGATLSGAVRDAISGAPIPAASVELRRPEAHVQNAMQGGLGFATSDGEGRFRFDHVPSARCRLLTFAAGHEARGIELDAARTDRFVDVTLRNVRRLTVHLTGVPASAIGTTIEWFLQPDPRGPACAFAMTSGRSTVIAPGELYLDAPPPGAYSLGFFPNSVLPGLVRGFEVSDAAPPELTIPVPGAVAVDGTLVGRDGTPIPDGAIRIGSSPISRTDTAGRFRIERVDAGLQPVWLGADSGSLAIRVGALEVSALSRAAAVVFAPGTASIDFSVSVSSQTYVILTSDDGTKIAEGQPNQERPVRIGHLPSGRFDVHLFNQDSAPYERRVELVDGQALELGAITLELHPVVPVRVRFPDGVNRPARVTVDMKNATPFSSGRIEFDGAGQGWLRGIPRGSHRLMFHWTSTRPAEERSTADVVVADGITSPIEIDLRAK